ncbi:hypothetical protein [Rhizobium sp. BK538]|uniref:hypothetical protein n=1 Tax=Rhizobium sp. BK538 TaxID=2586984 RepID=UPI0016176568|nr:hypothetical protein [Rhizobium sp. BK538]MBB4171791.1 hypothetical protein [Rhizobium sp. BK538]
MLVGAKAGGFSFYHDETKQTPGAGSPPPGLMRTWMRCRRLTGVAKRVPAAKQLARAPILKFLRKGNQVLQKMRRRTFAPLSDR